MRLTAEGEKKGVSSYLLGRVMFMLDQKEVT
jgi:hypothetical protein